jgi:Protein of unknown function (DUF1553)/Protein of unknown function (DUF1549)
MGSHRLKGRLAILCLAVLAAPSQAAPARTDTPNAEAAALAFRIDQLIDAGYKARNIQPVPLADDAEFLRRVYLDLTGRIPPVAEVHRFLKSKDPDKRRILVEELLASPNFITHFATVWRAAIIPPSNNQQFQFFGPQMEGWLRIRLRDDAPYDQMVRDLLTAEVGAGIRRGRNVEQGATTFYQVNEFKAENIAASSSRLFLGVKLECAQCHDHPFARWSRKQFWELAAFFTNVQGQQMVRPVNPKQPTPATAKNEIKISGTETVVKARFLDGKIPDFTSDASARKVLADWMTSRDNPFFAKAVVNRYWAHFFGIGIADPVDELENEDNPPSNPELLDDLAKTFAQKGFDTKFLIRAITSTKVYQRTSASATRGAGSDDLRSFSRMPLKGLTAEQLFDSLCQATGYRDNQPNPYVRGFNQLGSPRAEFLSRFDNSADKTTEHQTSILQALALMNGKLIADVTSIERSMTLQAVINSPFMDNKQKLDTLYMATLSRPMKPHEASKMLRYVEEGGPSKDETKALADVFWVLLNSGEFSINH